LVRFWTSGGAKCKVPQNGRFFVQNATESPLKNLTPLALSSPEKSVTVQNYKQTNKQTNKKQTVNDISTFYLVWIIKDNNEAFVYGAVVMAQSYSEQLVW